MQSKGQSTQCAADFIHNNLMQTDSAYRNQIVILESQVEAITKNDANNKLRTALYTIPFRRAYWNRFQYYGYSNSTSYCRS